MKDYLSFPYRDVVESTGLMIDVINKYIVGALNNGNHELIKIFHDISLLNSLYVKDNPSHSLSTRPGIDKVNHALSFLIKKLAKIVNDIHKKEIDNDSEQIDMIMEDYEDYYGSDSE